MFKDETEHSLKQTNARIYWDDLLAVRHFLGLLGSRIIMHKNTKLNLH